MKRTSVTTPAPKELHRHLRLSDIRGVAQLAAQATSGVTRIVEGVHHSVLNTMGIPGHGTPGRTRGVTGFVYRSIHGATSLLGKNLDAGLAGLEALLGDQGHGKPATPEREAFLAALNGIIGDRLLASDSPFAISMCLRHQDAVLNEGAAGSIRAASGKVVLLIHGLCMNDLRSHARHRNQRPDHGEVLASELGYTPVYLRYNSGLHISQNGHELAAQLEELVARWPKPIEELTVVAHSMGGLLIRSAHHAATLENLRWPKLLKNIVFLGTPHHGAPLEQAGNWVDSILGKTPYTAPFGSLGQLRSSGITDLRYGHLLDEDWQGGDRFEHAPDSRRIVPLPDGVACFAVAATTASQPGFLANRLIGDGLVPVDSALGRHRDARRDIGLPFPSQKVEYRMNHLELLSSPEVTRQMVRWLTPA